MRRRECIRRLWQRDRRRFSVSEIYEPPLGSTVAERPCTILLAEDAGVYQGKTWREAFQRAVPHEHGTSFRYLSIPDEHERTQDILDDWTQTDLVNIHDAVLVARGPFVGWAAQLYLESYSLLGLVLVDPLLMDTHKKELQTYYSFCKSGREHNQYQSLLSGTDSRPLLLEPGAVPTMILTTTRDERLIQAAHQVAERHEDSEGVNGEVVVEDFPSTGDRSPSEEIQRIMSWIDDRVL